MAQLRGLGMVYLHTKSHKTILTSSDPHHDMSGEACQGKVVRFLDFMSAKQRHTFSPIIMVQWKTK